MMDGMDGMGMGMVFMLLWGLVGVALLVLAVLGVVWLIRRLGSGSGAEPVSGSGDGGAARRELDRRLAAGEIDQEEYRRLRSEIEGG